MHVPLWAPVPFTAPTRSLVPYRKQLPLCRKQPSCLMIFAYPDAAGKELEFSSWILPFAKRGSQVVLTQMVILLCKERSAYLWGYQSCKSRVLHFIWKSVGWFPLCLSVWILANRCFSGSDFSSAKVVLQLMQMCIHVCHCDCNACLAVYLDMAHERFYLYLHIFVKWRIRMEASWKNL